MIYSAIGCSQSKPSPFSFHIVTSFLLSAPHSWTQILRENFHNFWMTPGRRGNFFDLHASQAFWTQRDRRRGNRRGTTAPLCWSWSLWWVENESGATSTIKQMFKKFNKRQELRDSIHFRELHLRNQRLISYLPNLQHPNWWGLRLLQPCWWRLSFRIWSRVDFGRVLDISEYGVRKLDASFLAHYLDYHEALGKIPFRTVTGVLTVWRRNYFFFNFSTLCI